MKTTFAIAALLFAGALAAPTNMTGLDCHKAVESKRLVVDRLSDGKKYAAGFSTKYMDGKYPQLALTSTHEVEQTFSFLECKAPSHEFRGKHRGLIVSDDQPGMCMTIKKVDNRNSDEGYDVNNGRLSLQPCKRAHDPALERQWIYLNEHEVMSDGKHSTRAHVKLLGEVVALAPGPSIETPDILQME